MTTYKVWQGPSEIDGTDILMLLVTNSSNSKTGPMLQTYIMRSDMPPHVAIKEGKDTAVCGSCVFRGKESGGNGGCYVLTFQGPHTVWNQWKEGKADLLPRLPKRHVLRVGAYGEPVAVPFDVWKPLLDRFSNTGYTERWDLPGNQVWKDYIMASVQSQEEADRAHAMGWRTFFVTPKGDDVKRKSTIVCPASKERGQLVQCIDCMQCGGLRSGRTVSVQIQQH